MILAMLCLAAAIPAAAKTVTVTKYKNIAVGKSYTDSGDLFTGTDNEYQKVDGKEFTDGAYGSDLYGGEWVAFDKRIAGGAHRITVDLGKTESGIGRLNLVLRHAGGDGVGLPSSVRFSVSDDGATFKQLGTATQVENAPNLDYELVSDPADFKGRYFRAEFGGATTGVFVFVCEFEIGIPDGTAEIEIPVDESTRIHPLGGSGLTIDDNDVLGVIKHDTTVEQLYALCCESSGELSLLAPDGKVRTGKVHSGDALTRTSAGKELSRATVAVLGDVSGSGDIGSGDYAMVKRYCLGNYDLSAWQIAAGDINRSGDIEPTEYAMLKRHVLATYDIFEKYEEDDKMLLSDTDMKFTKVSDKLYRMETTYQGKPYSLTFDKKSERTEGASENNWGTWNIGTATYNGEAMAGGGTDWEYVYRASSDNKGGWCWSGGNHGNEKFLSLEIFDTATGEKKELSNGSSFTSKGVTIVEKTHLHWGDMSKYYAEVTRTYRLAGTVLTLDVDYNYVRDSYFYMSYTCMFPIHKPYGRHSRFYHTDGTTHESFTTDGTVYEPYGNHYDSGNAALKVTFWGEKHPTWKFDVEVFTPYDSTNNFDNNSKTMIWDMNTSSDKLYVSKYESGVASLIKAGEKRHTQSSWTFYVGE